MPSKATELDRSGVPAEVASQPVTGPANGEGNRALLEAAGEGADVGLVEEEILVEEISIDGMCGVY